MEQSPTAPLQRLGGAGLSAVTGGLVLLIVIGWLIALHRRDPLLAIGISGATPTGAFATVGGIAIPTVYAGVFFALAMTGLIRVRRMTLLAPPSRAVLTLWVFAFWSVLVTMVAPFLFDGLLVVALGSQPRPLSAVTFLTSSNIAQMLYLVLGVAVAALASRRPLDAVRALWVALAGTALLSIWRYAGLNLGVPFPTGFFDNSPAFRYIDGAPGGIVRFRGILSEPAGLAASSLACIAVGSSLLIVTRGWRRAAVAACTLAAVVNLSQSTSATGIIAATALIIIAVLAFFGGLVLRGRRWSAPVVVGVILTALAAIWVLPLVTGAVSATVDAKVGTSSFDERSGTDAYSFGLVLRTWGIGVGLGSNRPSSFLAALLAATGVIGGALFLGVLLRSIVRGARDPLVRPALWGLVAIMLAKVASSPDLSDTSGALWLAIGAVIGARASISVPAPMELRGSGRHRSSWMGNRRIRTDPPPNARA